jgi:glycosyltransferase involved in cell wall biosynthesis
MRLSIVIPTKNEENYLPRLLESIRKQAFSDYEVIVADAGSSDRTREIAQGFGAKVVEGGLPGPGRNRGAEAAQGERLLFLDADVILPSANFLTDMVQEMDERNVDVATTRWTPDPVSTIDHAIYGFYNTYTLATERLLPHAMGCCILIKRELFERLKGFDEAVLFAEDHDLARRAVALGARFGVMRRHKLLVSVRRFVKDGRFGFALKCLYTELHMVAKGPLRKLPFTYEFAHFDREDRP